MSDGAPGHSLRRFDLRKRTLADQARGYAPAAAAAILREGGRPAAAVAMPTPLGEGQPELEAGALRVGLGGDLAPMRPQHLACDVKVEPCAVGRIVPAHERGK